MNKKELRELAKNKLTSIPPAARAEITEKLVRQLLQSQFWKAAQTVGVTVSSGFEWDTTPIIEAGWQEGKKVVVPKCAPADRRLDFYQLEHFGQLEESFYNLQEPDPQQTEKIEKVKIDLLIVPGLLFDRRGYRIGFGGGYYDRYLVDYPNITVSLCSSRQLVDQVPNEDFDIPLQGIITEEGLMMVNKINPRTQC